jgi:HSP20 family molecular chaperone IbpA
MHEQNVVRHQTTEPPIVIRTTGLSVEAKEMLDAIARRAYNIFEAKGRIKGRDLDNWLQAEAELFERTPLNIGESQDGVTVLAEVRDFTPKDLEIDLEPKRVTIIGRDRTHAEQKAGTSTGSQKRTVRLLRSVQLPVEIDAAHATARFKGGVIELKLKKAMPRRMDTEKAKAVSNSNIA